jgi:hypothetical protein
MSKPFGRNITSEYIPSRECILLGFKSTTPVTLKLFICICQLEFPDTWCHTWWLPAKGCTWLSVAVPGNNEIGKPFGDAGLPLFFNGQCVCIIRILRGVCPGLQAVYLPKPHSVPLEFWTNIDSIILNYKQGRYELSRHLPPKHHHHWDTKKGDCIRRDIAQERIRRFFVDYWLHYACMPGKSLTRVAATRFKNNKMRKLQREDTFVRS